MLKTGCDVDNSDKKNVTYTPKTHYEKCNIKLKTTKRPSN